MAEGKEAEEQTTRPPLVLAIDTATRLASVALYDGEQVRSEETWHAAANHTVTLMPSIVRMVERQQLSPQALTGLAVALGPGSFTGLRIGLAVAKGLAVALKIPLVGVPTLDIVAYPHQSQRQPICAVVQAGRGRICAGFYARSRNRWRQVGDYLLTTPEELCEQIKGRTLFCGELPPSAEELLRERLGLSAIIASPANSLRRAGYLAELGYSRLQRGQADDVTTLAPIYLHQPV